MTFDTIYEKFSDVFDNHTINLKEIGLCDPWVIGLVCLKAIEYKDSLDKQLILPEGKEIISYLRQVRLHVFLEKLTYHKSLQPFQGEMVERKDLNIHEIMHCEFRDEFGARLSSRIRTMFKNFGMDTIDESRATGLVGELGNNVFDHNEGSWPSSIRGAIIFAQQDIEEKQIEVIVADPGIGFRGSLKIAKPSPKDDIEAIKLGLSGVTGRIGERRGNGLRVIQDWTINKFDGIVRIHSGNGLVIVDKNGQSAKTVFPVIGTLASFVVRYK